MQDGLEGMRLEAGKFGMTAATRAREDGRPS